MRSSMRGALPLTPGPSPTPGRGEIPHAALRVKLRHTPFESVERTNLYGSQRAMEDRDVVHQAHEMPHPQSNSGVGDIPREALADDAGCALVFGIEIQPCPP